MIITLNTDKSASKMFASACNSLKYLYVQRNLYLKVVNAHFQSKQLFSSKPPKQLFENDPENPQKKRKTQPIPKITLISSDNNISVTTLEEAQHLSKRRDLKLVKIVDLDTKTQRPIYKLMSGSEYHAEELKYKEQIKKEKQSSNALKGEKLLMLNGTISKHDLETNIRKIIKWISKRYEVRIVISVNNSNIENAENVYKRMEEALQDQTRFVQKRVKGNDLRFQIIPPKNKETANENL